MDWTRISGNTSSFNNWFNGTTYFKVRFPTVNFEDNYVWDNFMRSSLYTLYFHIGTYGQARYGMRDSFIGTSYNFTSVGSSAINPIDFAELNINDIEIYMFKDSTDESHYLTEVIYTTPRGRIVHAHYGVDINDGEHFLVGKDQDSNNKLDILPLVTNLQTNNNNFGEDYIIQPLYLYDEKSPIYTVCGNTTLAAFTTFIIDNKKFMVIGKGLCVEVD